MRYHLKEDGTPGPCKAEPGKCPKGDAIHGDSVQEVYAQLERVMQDQLFKSKESLYPEPAPRKSAREIGMAGRMITTRQPFVIRQQLEGLKSLGLIEEALPVLEKYQPILAAAAKTDKEDLVDWDGLYERPREYTYDGSDGGRFIGQEDTWTVGASYELQTVAQNYLMDKLETGELEGTDLKALGKALGHITPPENYPDKGFNGRSTDGDSFNFDYMAFNWNEDRQPDDFFNGVINRLAREGFERRKTGQNKHEVTVPDFLWKGLDQEAKERFAAQVIISDIHSFGKTFQERIFNDRGVSGFRSILSSTFAPNKGFGRLSMKDGEPARVGLDHNGSYAIGIMKLTEKGFQWTETERRYVEPRSY